MLSALLLTLANPAMAQRTPPALPPAYTQTGSGTVWDPWIINTAQKWESIGDRGCNDTHTDGCDDVFLVTADIDLSGRALNPIGTAINAFEGAFFGGGYTLSNASVSHSGDDDIGLFGFTDGAYIVDMTVDGAVVEGDYDVGALIGYASNGTVVDEITLVDCSVDGINGAGAAIGRLDDGAIYDTGVLDCAVNGGHTAGGLVGYLIDADIRRSWVDGASTVYGVVRSGGLVGSASGASDIEDSYSRASATGASYTAGLLAWASTGVVVTDCYAAGYLPTGAEGILGLAVGYPSFSGVVWDEDTTGDSSAGPSGTTGKTTAQMKSATTYAGLGWDFGVWTITNGAYPSL